MNNFAWSPRFQRHKSCSLLCFTESWLHSLVSDSACEIDGFTLVRSDRGTSTCRRLCPHAAATASGGSSNCRWRYEPVKSDLTVPGFKQYVKGEMRYNKLLDKRFINVEGAYVSRIRPPIATSDHNVVHLIPTYKSKLKHSKPEKKVVFKFLSFLKFFFSYFSTDVLLF